MFCIYKDGAFTECFGNMVFSPSVFQTAESLTDEQRIEFSVFQVREEYPELAPDFRHCEEWTYRVENGEVVRTWAQREIPIDERNQRLAKNIDALWRAADAYVAGYISGVAIGLLTMGVLQQKPKAYAVTAWSSSVWDEYYKRKAAMTYDATVDADFSAFGPIPHSVPDLRAELGL